ncbi:MAG: hypothetical protein EAZ57_05090, partial [Cytophagales bacterium]
MSYLSLAQCPVGQSEVVLILYTDDDPTEVTYSATFTPGGTVTGGPTLPDTKQIISLGCFNTGATITMSFTDSGGDGVTGFTAPTNDWYLGIRNENGCIEVLRNGDATGNIIAGGGPAVLAAPVTNVAVTDQGLNCGTEDCASKGPLCVDGLLRFTPGAGNGIIDDNDLGVDYNCSGSPSCSGSCFVSSGERNPGWFFLKIETSGDIVFTINGSPPSDYDFVLWGPFDSPDSCGASLNPAIDCSFAGSTVPETVNIVGAVAGQYYVLLVNDFSLENNSFTLEQTGGTGTTDCSIFCSTELGPNRVYCDFDDVDSLNASKLSHDTDFVYEWFVDGVSQGPPTHTRPKFLPTQQSLGGIPTTYLYLVEVTDTVSDCIVRDSMRITFNPLPIKTRLIAPQDDSFCPEGSTNIQIFASQDSVIYELLKNGVPYVPPVKVIGNGGTILLPTGLITTTTNFSVRAVMDSTLCEVIMDDTVTVVINSALDVTKDPDVVVCDDSPPTLDATGLFPAPVTYQWYQDGVLLPGATAATYTPTVSSVGGIPTTYVYIVEITAPSLGCSGYDTINVRFNPRPLSKTILSGGSVCGDGSATVQVLLSDAGINYSLLMLPGGFPISGGFAGTGGTITLTTWAFITDTTRFLVQATNPVTGCRRIFPDTVTVIHHPLPSADIGGGSEVCIGDSVDVGVT